MIYHDYLSTDAPCPNCGGRMLADVAIRARSNGVYDSGLAALTNPTRTGNRA